MSLSMTSSAFSGAITGHGDGIVDPRDHAASMAVALDLSSLPQAAQALGDSTLRMEMIMDGQDVYERLPQAVFRANPSLAEKPWLKMNLAKAAGISGLSPLGSDPTGNDPRQMLQYLTAASDGITNEGRQQVDGVQTTHYHAALSLDRLTADLPAADRSAAQQAIAKLRQTIGSDLPVDVWIDAHQLIRRMAMSLSLHVPSGPSVQETVVGDLSDYGPQPRPTLPPADQVQDASALLAGVNVSG
jgi:hypothetical protein